MKICIPTLGDKGLDEAVSPHFGTAPTFTIVDSETGEAEAIPNTSSHMGGTKLPPELLAEKGVNVMLCSGLGMRAIQLFRQFGIEVYMGAEGAVRDAFEAWKNGSLRPATDLDGCAEHQH